MLSCGFMADAGAGFAPHDHGAHELLFFEFAKRNLAERRQAAAVIENIERRIGDHRRKADRRSKIGLTLERTGCRVDIDERTIGPGDDQSVAGEDRT